MDHPQAALARQCGEEVSSTSTGNVIAELLLSINISFMQNNINASVFSEVGDNIPSYVSDVIKDNRRQNTNLARVRCRTFTNQTNTKLFETSSAKEL